MTKQILSAVVIATITFTGCSTVSDTAKSATKAVTNTAKGATKAVTDTAKSATKSVSDAVDSNKSAVDTKTTSMKTNLKEKSLKVGDVVETKVEMEKATATSALPTSTSYTEQAKTKAIEVADEKTDGKASQVIEVIK